MPQVSTVVSLEVPLYNHSNERAAFEVICSYVFEGDPPDRSLARYTWWPMPRVLSVVFRFYSGAVFSYTMEQAPFGVTCSFVMGHCSTGAPEFDGIQPLALRYGALFSLVAPVCRLATRDMC